MNTCWEKLVERKSDYWKNSMLLSSFKRMEHFFGFTLQEHLTTREGMNFTHWMSRRAAQSFSKRVEQEIQNDTLFTKKVMSVFREAQRRILSINHILQRTHFPSLSQHQLDELFWEFCRRYKDLYPAFHLGVYAITLEERIQQWLSQTLPRHNQTSRHDAIFAALVAPNQLSYSQEEEVALYNIALAHGAETMLKAHIDRYAGLPVLHDEIPPWPHSYFEERLQTLLGQSKQQLLKKRLVFLATPVAAERERTKIFHTFSTPPLIRTYAKFIGQTTWIRLAGRDTFCLAHHASQPLFQEIGERCKLPVETIKWLSEEEIRDLLLHGCLPPKKMLMQRKKHSVLLFRHGRIHIKHGHHARQFIQEELTIDEEKYDQKLVRGTTAYPGCVSGRVKIIMTHHDGEKMGNGDILVTRMTTTNLLPFLKMASAIITDEGGVTCHAAIIARELKIPCIIGTKIATRLFNNGDRVEIDAERGIIKKIS